jgi:hypothetical protein
VWLRHNVTERFYGWIAYTLSRSEVTTALAEGVPMIGGNNGHAAQRGPIWRGVRDRSIRRTT